MNSYVSMGMVNSGRIETDMGNILILDSSSIKKDLLDGERVFLHCNILNVEGKDTYRVRIDKYFPLLTKEFVHSSESNESELGNDPINSEKAWFGGGFLNVCVGVMHNASSNVSHAVNLVYDDKASNADTAYFELRHHAFEDTIRTVKGKAYASFNLQSLLADGLSKVYVILKWRWYNSHGIVMEHKDGGYYMANKRENVNESPENGSVSIG